jgi:broad specificity phosphatase PhoE
MTLYYIRHAQVVANTLDPAEITYENSEALTDLGLQQISELTTYLVGMNVTPDAVLVSPTKRTQKTIEPYLVAKKITGVIWMELTECCTQTPSGGAIPTQPIFASYRATIEGQNLVFRDPNATKYWQNDTYEAGLLMVTTAKNDLLSQFSQSGKTIFVVGHASAGSVLLNLMRGVDVSAGTGATSSTALYLMNTGVQRLVQDPATGAFKLDGRNLNQPRTE